MTHDDDRRERRKAGGRGVLGRADVWLGDLAVALEEIAPADEEGFWRIARLLGLGAGSGPGSGSASEEDLGPGSRAGARTVRRQDADGLPTPPQPSETAVLRLDMVPGGEPTPTAASSTDVRGPVAAAPDRTAGGPSPLPPDGAWKGDGARGGDGLLRSAAPAEGRVGRGTSVAHALDTTPRGDPDSAHEPGPPHHEEHLPPRVLVPAEPAHVWHQSWTRNALPRPDRELMRGQSPYTPLLARSSTVALLEAALSGTARDGDVEIEDVVELLARGLPLASLPRRVRRTLRHGVQVLVDHGPAMEPFARDQAELCKRVRALVGRDKTEELHFARSPLHGAGAGPSWTWEAYDPPPRGGAVLLLSDCGTIGLPGDHARSTPEEWRRFAESVRRGGARPLALVPVPQRRVPGWLSAVMPVLCWDRGTTVGRVAAQVGAWRECFGAPWTPFGSEGGPVSGHTDEDMTEERRILPPAPPAHAVDLATLLSTTVRVEPELMRAVRVALLPQADVGAESDLWFSEWVATRSARAMALRVDVQRALRPRLPEVLARCASPPGVAPADHLRDLITGCHRHLSPLMLIEEEVLWLVSRDEGDGAGVRRAEEALRSALRALVEDRGREAIADWIVSVGRRLPQRLRRTVTGWQFRSIASFLEPDTAVGAHAPDDIGCRDAALVVRAVAASGEAEVPDTHIAVRSVGDALHIGGDGEGRSDSLLISVPATDPVVLELRSGRDGCARPLHVSPGERVTVPGCTADTRLVAANGHVYDPFGALRSPLRGHAPHLDPHPASPPTVFLSSASRDPFSQMVRDQLDARLRRFGYEVRDLGELWPTPHRTDDATAAWPERMDAVVFLLDRELLGSSAVYDQIEILNAWAARSGVPKPFLVPLRDLPHTDRERLTRRVGAEERQWVMAVMNRPWMKDHPWGDGHAREFAEYTVSQVVPSVSDGPAPTGRDRNPFPTRYQLLARMLDKYLRRYSAHGDRGVLERAAGLFVPDPEAPLPGDEAAVLAFVLLARVWRQLAHLTGSVDYAYGAVRLLGRVVTRAQVATGPPGERGATRPFGQAVSELLRAWSDYLDLTDGTTLPDHVVAGLDEAVRLGREVLRTERRHVPFLELTACLAHVAANESWLRRHPEETEAAALLNLDAADAAHPGSRAPRIAAARTAARLAIAADAMPLAVRAHDRWFALLERTDWGRVDGAECTAVTEGVAGAAENAAACALAAGEPPAEVVRLLERGLAVHRVVLAARSLYGHDAGSCQPEWRRRSRLRREVARISAWSADEAPRMTGDEGPVAVLLASDVRGAALILDGGTVTLVSVPGLTAAAARRWTPGSPDMREALRPVVQELERGSRNGDASRTRRVFWCPTGPLSRLPVHEAWSPELDGAGAVPSYVSSLSEFLGAAHAGPAELSSTRARPVVVVSPGAHDTVWTARAEAEVRAIKSTGMDFDLLSGDQATRLAVLEAASDVEVVHLVGRPVPHHGGGWAIALADGPLIGADIAAADLSRTRLAVLSGYGESVGGGSEPDWDTLAGGLHRAGCRHVVTSLSPPGPSVRGVDEFVTRFYDALLDGDRLPRPGLAPFALQRASAAVHQPGRDRCLPHHVVHIGT